MASKRWRRSVGLGLVERFVPGAEHPRLRRRPRNRPCWHGQRSRSRHRHARFARAASKARSGPSRQAGSQAGTAPTVPLAPSLTPSAPWGAQAAGTVILARPPWACAVMSWPGMPGIGTLLDQNLSFRLVEVLRPRFPGSVHVRDLLRARVPDIHPPARRSRWFAVFPVILPKNCGPRSFPAG
jgi:hypothetical protein